MVRGAGAASQAQQGAVLTKHATGGGLSVEGDVPALTCVRERGGSGGQGGQGPIVPSAIEHWDGTMSVTVAQSSALGTHHPAPPQQGHSSVARGSRWA